MDKKTEALKLAQEAIDDRASLTRWKKARDAIREALAEQPAQQEPVAEVKLKERGGNAGLATVIHEIYDPMREPLRVGDKLYTAPPASKPLFKEFIKWAGAQGYDCAQTCNSDTGEWICLNPMTADLWKAWQAAHGIKGDA